MGKAERRRRRSRPVIDTMESLNAMYLCMPITFPTVAIPMNAYILIINTFCNKMVLMVH